jgi:hypothetical protein
MIIAVARLLLWTLGHASPVFLAIFSRRILSRCRWSPFRRVPETSFLDQHRDTQGRARLRPAFLKRRY